MSIEICRRCCDPSTHVDTDYNAEDIYRPGINDDFVFTGNERDVAALCHECLIGVLDRSGISEEEYCNKFA